MPPALPVETLHQICETTPFNRTDLLSLVTTSQVFSERTRPLLYRNFAVQLGRLDSTKDSLELLLADERVARAVQFLTVLGFWKTQEDHSLLVNLLISAVSRMEMLQEIQRCSCSPS